MSLGSTALCQASLVGFASQNRASLISSYRALMPILSLQTRNPLLPDIAKVRRSCHKAAIAVSILSFILLYMCMYVYHCILCIEFTLSICSILYILLCLLDCGGDD